MIDIAGDLESFPGSMTASVGRWMYAGNPPERFAKNELGPAVWKDEPLLAIVDWE